MMMMMIHDDDDDDDDRSFTLLPWLGVCSTTFHII